MPSSSAVVTAGLASGACFMASHAFVTPLQPPASIAAPGILSTSAAPVQAAGNFGRSSTMVALGAAGVLGMAASTNRRMIGSRTVRRAEAGDKTKVLPTLAEWVEAGGYGLDANVVDATVQAGVTAPFGFFDPLGFCAKGDAETFRKLRTAEIKHGRVAMMASVGACAQHYVKFPGFEKVPAGLGAVTDGVGAFGTIALVLVAGALELGLWTENTEKEPGNFGDPMGMSKVGNNYCNNYVDMCNRELNNGRFCMFAIVGIVGAELATGKDAIQQFTF